MDILNVNGNRLEINPQAIEIRIIIDGRVVIATPDLFNMIDGKLVVMCRPTDRHLMVHVPHEPLDDAHIAEQMIDEE